MINKNFFIFTSALAFWDGDDVGHVLEIDGERQFNDTLVWNENVLVAYCDPNANICKNFLPEYHSAADLLSQERPRMVLALVDCTTPANEPICIRDNVKEYVHIRFYQKSKMSETKPILRSMEHIIKFMRAHCSVATYHIRDKESFEKHVSHPQGSFIGFFESTQGITGKCGKHEEKNPEIYAYKRAYLKIVQSLIDDYRFGHITDRELAKDLFATDENPEGPWNTIMFHKNLKHANKFEQTYHYYDKKQLASGLVQKWVTSFGLGACPIVTQDNFHLLNGPIVMAYYKMDFERDPARAKYWRNRLLKFTSEQTADLMYKYQFAVGARKLFADTIFEDLGGHEGWGEDAPKIVLWDRHWNAFIMDENLESDCKNLKLFLKSYEAGELKPYVKSDKPPKKNDGAVTVVVGTTFRDIVLDNSKDVFIEFYAPWCEYCKAIETPWKELGEAFIDDDNIVIAKMDVSGNHPPRIFAFDGFPTIYWSAMGNKMNPKKYDGPRELEGFISFIRREAAVKPIILNGEADTIDYDDYDNEIIVGSEDDADEVIEGERLEVTTTTASPKTENAPPVTTTVSSTTHEKHDEL